MRCLEYFVLFLSLLSCIAGGDAIKIQYYEGSDTTGYYKEINEVKATCNNNPREIGTVTKGSIKTDTCLIAFRYKDCYGATTKILPGTYNINPALFHTTLSFMLKYETANPTGISSYFPCNDKEGGPQLNVDVFWNGGRQQVEFKDMCGCRDLPEAAQNINHHYRADNHGNAFMKYTQENCKGEGKLVPPGINEMSGDLNLFGEEWNEAEGKMVGREEIVKSIGPSNDTFYYRNHCIKLTSSIYKFEFLPEENETDNEHTLNMEDSQVSLETVFRNNGSAKITQEYKVTKEIKETAEIEIAEGFSNMHKVEVEVSLEVEGKGHVPFLSDGGFKAGLKTAYAKESTTTGSTTKKNVVETTRKDSTKHQIEVPPCTIYTAKSVVKMVKNKKMKYNVYSKVTGKLGGNGQRMTAKMIRENLGEDLQVLEDLDEWTVKTVGKAIIKASYGIKTAIIGDGVKISGCKA